MAYFVTLTLQTDVPYSLPLHLLWRVKERGMKHVFQLHLNGEVVEVLAPVHKTLLEVLREDLQLTGTKHGCELGECGTCTVLLDGMPALACLLLPIAVQGQEILTIEGIAIGSTLHELQNTFSELGAAQCGYCTPGILLTAMALLRTHPMPDRQQIKEALAGNLCRCTGYVKILEAVELAVQRLLTD
jgi:aerobic-type carbon monoxide dehydrogenase small subunit (CoxS/CutS family)